MSLRCFTVPSRMESRWSRSFDIADIVSALPVDTLSVGIRRIDHCILRSHDLIMALHDEPVDCLASGTHRHRRSSERSEIIAPQLVAGNRHRTCDAVSTISLASSAPPSACVPSVAAPPADVPSFSVVDESAAASTARTRTDLLTKPSLKLLVDGRLQKTQ